ncbi:MAG: hypothetical protein OQL16_04485 [Gammaproteobacteria bacterium]|nr:hypothetical protein [Gammaproteobacteria bacterium]
MGIDALMFFRENAQINSTGRAQKNTHHSSLAVIVPGIPTPIA